MVRIPRTEAQVGFQPSQQPTWNSGSASLPGKALEGFGRSLASIGDAFQGEIDKQNEFQANLALLNWDNEETKRQIEAQANFNRDNPDGWALESHGARTERFNSVLSSMPNERLRQKAQLHFASRGHNFYEGDQRFEFGKRNEMMFRSLDTAITGEFAAPDLNDVNGLPDKIQGKLAGIDAMIAQYPGSAAQKEQLRKSAATLALDRMREAYTAAGKLDEFYPAAKGFIERLGIAPPAPSGTPGPQSQAPAFGNVKVAAASGDHSFVTSGSGARFRVGTAHAERFAGLIADLEAHGLKIDSAQSGGYNDRNIAGTNTKSRHAFAEAIDINWNENARGKPGRIRDVIPVEKIREIAAKHGMRWGGDWRNPDDMHFEVIRGAQPPVPMAQRGITTFAGMSSPSAQPATPASPVSFEAPVESAIADASKATGVDVSMLKAIAQIESSGKPGTTTGSYKGLFQLSDDEFLKHGGAGNIYDARQNAIAAARKIKAESEAFEKKFGRAPTPSEIYLIHQQGEGGAAAHMRNPDAPAWQNMASTGEGRAKGEAWAKKAIWGNLTDADKKKFGSVENVTSRDFVALWDQKVQKWGGVAAQPPSALGATSKGSDVPEKQRVSLAGLDPAGKAKRLEELVGQGYQSVIHQLDNNGDDVLIVRKSDRPEWYKNTRGDGKGPSELDKPDFAGPAWANDSIKKIRAGEVRPQNTIPASGNKVADASGKVVPIPRAQTASSVFQEELLKRLDSYAREHEVAQDKWAKEVSGKINQLVDMAEKGYEPRPDLIGAIDEAVNKKPELAKRYGLDMAADGVQAFITQQMQIRTLRPQELEAGLRAVTTELQTNGATPDLIKRKERMEKLLGEMKKGVNEDPIGWADRVGVAKVQPIDWSKPETLDARLAHARTVADHYGQPVQFFTAAEREALKDQLKVGGKQMLGMLGAMYQAFGPETVNAMAEISKQAPEAAIAGYMMAKNLNPQTVEDIAAGIERQQKRALGEKGIVPIKPVEGRPAFIETAGRAFARLPSSEGALIEATNAAYEARAQRMGWTEPKADEWKKIMREVVGETTDKQGNVFGGFQSFGGGHKIVMPPNIKNVEGFRNSGNSFRMLMDAVRPEDLIDAFGANPTSGNNTPLSISTVRTATPISVGEGRYLLAMGDPNSDDPMLIQNGKGGNFVLDLNALEGKLRQRRPDLFKGYDPLMPAASTMP